MCLSNKTAERRERQTLVCNKRDKAITRAFCRHPHLKLLFSGLLHKDLFIVAFITQGLRHKLGLQWQQESLKHKKSRSKKMLKFIRHASCKFH